MNKSKIAGTRFETECVRFLQDNGFPHARRKALAGKNDGGDVDFEPYIAEAKNTQRIDLAGGIDELTKEIVNAGVRHGFLLIKRRRKPTSEAYVVMTFAQLVALLKEVR